MWYRERERERNSKHRLLSPRILRDAPSSRERVVGWRLIKKKGGPGGNATGSWRGFN